MDQGMGAAVTDSPNFNAICMGIRAAVRGSCARNGDERTKRIATPPPPPHTQDMVTLSTQRWKIGYTRNRPCSFALCDGRNWPLPHRGLCATRLGGTRGRARKKPKLWERRTGGGGCL